MSSASSTPPEYWRSLDGLADSEESRQYREREFPEGASEAPDMLTRRQALTLMGASVSLASLAACRRPTEHIVPYVNAPEQVIPGVPRHYATTMPSGTSAYGLVVENHEGRPTKIEGNELHPATLGSSSARVQAAVLDLYDPDRSPFVTSKGEATNWDAFVNAWKVRAKTHADDGGASLALLLPPFASPTLFRSVDTFRKAFPKALVVVAGPVTDRNLHAGVARAAGRALLGVQHFDKARAVLAIDSDFLNTDAEMIRNTRGYSAARRLAKADDSMLRLWSVEAVFSNTGANADHRLRVPARSIPAVVAALAAELGAASAAAPPEGVDAAWLKAAAADLSAHRGASLIVAGPRQPAAVHAAVLALNQHLGNLGATLEYHEPVDALLPTAGGLVELTTALGAGRVKTLVIAGGNPAYDAPADLDFVNAARKAEEVIHLGLHRDETGQLATWHIPQAHFLEAWDDARASCGTLSVVQPMILPLYSGKSAAELLHLLASSESKAAYDLVRETWQGLLGADFEKKWRRVLHDGVLDGSALPAVTVAAGNAAAFAGELATLSAPAASGDIDLVFAACPKVGDGSAANNPWLQELPDPLTKVTWDNPLLVSPKTADAKGLKDGDIVKVEAGGRSLELPIFRVPGMAERTAVAVLGYGRTSAGRAANGVGFATYALRGAAQMDLAPASISATGRNYALAQTQEHGSMDGRSIVRSASLAAYRKNPKFAADHEELFSLWKEHEYKSRPQWGMVIDLGSCTGCNACAVACQSENNIPVVGRDQVSRGREMAWIRIDRYFTGEPEDAGAVFQPVPCMQCENAPCEQVCPVAATVHDAEGLNAMVYNRCIGTRYCSNNCPYKVRHFNFYNYTKDTPELFKMANNPDVTVRARGVMEKCTYCVQRISEARIDARLGGRELKDGDVKTACQQACPAEAIRFGDILDQQSAVAAARASDRNYSLLAELNTKPRTTYLARVRNPDPALEPEKDAPAEHA